jgi:hypothetical protein
VKHAHHIGFAPSSVVAEFDKRAVEAQPNNPAVELGDNGAVGTAQGWGEGI